MQIPGFRVQFPRAFRAGATVSVGIGLLLGLEGHAQYQANPVSSAERSFLWPEGKRAAVSLTFDDGRVSQLDVGVPILDRHGVKATFFVNPGPVTERLRRWKQVVAGGHEIGNHSANHPCTGNFPWARHKALEAYSWETMASEIDSASRQIQELLGVFPKTFAYPCGQKYVGRGRDVRSYVPLVAERFLAGRGWLDEGPNDPAFCDLSQVLGMELDGLSFQEAKLRIEEAATRGMWLVFCGHDVGESGRQTVLSPTLDAICRYASDPANGLWIDTVARIATYIRDTAESAPSRAQVK